MWWFIGVALASTAVEPYCADDEAQIVEDGCPVCVAGDARRPPRLQEVDLGSARALGDGVAWVPVVLGVDPMPECEVELVPVGPDALLTRRRVEGFDGRVAFTRRSVRGRGTVELTAFHADGRPAWVWVGRFRRRTGSATQHGPWQAWYPNGRLAERGRFEEGLPEGRWTAFHAVGMLAEEGVYFAGRPHGPWACIQPGGAVSAGGDYADGRRVRGWRWYDARGEIAQTHDYGDGGELVQGRARLEGALGEGWIPALCAPPPERAAP